MPKTTDEMKQLVSALTAAYNADKAVQFDGIQCKVKGIALDFESWKYSAKLMEIKTHTLYWVPLEKVQINDEKKGS